MGQMLYQPVGGKERIEYGARDEELYRRYGCNDSNNSRRYSILNQMEVFFSLYIIFVNNFM